MKKFTLSIITLLAFNFVHSQIVNIPDANFKDALLNYDPVIDTNGDNEIQVSEAEVVTTLNVSSQAIIDLTGIEAFTTLEFLNCGWNYSMTSLNLSQNPALEYLNCYANSLTSLDMSQNTSLTELYCNNNSSLTTLDLPPNNTLTILHCENNSLTSIDLSQNTTLEHLECWNNLLTSLDLFQNTVLEYFDCNDNLLSSLDLSQNTSLDFLYCYNNSLETLDLSQNTTLMGLNCSYNNFIELDLSTNTNLFGLYCNNNSNLNYINLKNGNNENISLYDSSFENLPNLQNVCVDALNTDLTSFITTEVGHSVNFTTDCETVNIESKQYKVFEVYPNPVTNTLTISTNSFIDAVKIYNELGQLLSITKNINTINTTSLINGIYYIKIIDTNGNTDTRKIIKKL